MQDQHGPDWAQYIHRPHRWQCRAQEHSTPYVFDREQDLAEHVKEYHDSHIPDSRHRTALIMSITAKMPISALAAHICPFCRQDIKATLAAGIAKDSRATTTLLANSMGGSTAEASRPAPTRDQAPSPADYQNGVAVRMSKHIADHLQSLALWSLRWWDDDSSSSNELKGGSQAGSLQASERAISDRSPIIEDLWNLSGDTILSMLNEDDMLSESIRTAEALRKASDWDGAQALLRDACARYASGLDVDDDNTAATLGNQDSFKRALRATGELYRWSLTAQHSADDQRRTFGRSGIEWMVKAYRSAGQSIPEVAEILDCYETVAQRIATASADRTSMFNTRQVHKVADRLVRAIRRRNRTDALYYLCLIKAGDFDYEPLQPALPLAVRNDWGEVVYAVLEMKGDVNSQDEHCRTALFYCAASGRASYAKQFVDLGAFLDQPDDEQQTPLLVASRLGHREVVELLITGQANTESKDNHYGQTPLSWAAEEGHEAVVRLILEKGADTESKDNNYAQTPLSWAAEKGHEAVVRLLLEKGADTESRDNSGRTPLSWAAEKGHEAVVRLILEKGADTESKDNNYAQTPLSWAAEKGHEAVVRLLLEKGADTESRDNSGLTPLSWAAEKGREAVVKLLLEKGADTESRDDSGLTPLSRAAGNEAVVKLLRTKS
jgi:ankyrin repeat protein